MFGNRNNKGSALLQALLVTLMVALLVGSVGSYVMNSSSASRRLADLEGYAALGNEISAFAADSNLCPESIQIADGQFGNLGANVNPTSELLQFRGILSTHLLNPPLGAPSGFDFDFAARNTWPWFPNYGWAVGNPLDWFSRGPGRMYITSIRYENIQPKVGGTFGNVTEWEGDLVIQAFPMTADLQNVVQERALASKTISKLYVAYLFDPAANQGRIVRCNADADPGVYCTELGGSYRPDAPADQPRCLFAFPDTIPCGPNRYIKDFDSAGIPICDVFNPIPCGPGYYATGIYKNERMVCRELDPCPVGYVRHGGYCVPVATAPTVSPSPTTTLSPTMPSPTPSGTVACEEYEQFCDRGAGAGCESWGRKFWDGSSFNFIPSTCEAAGYTSCPDQYIGQVMTTDPDAMFCPSGPPPPTPPPCDVCEPGYSDVIAGRSWQSCGHVFNAFTNQCEVTAWQSNSLPAYPCQYIGGNPDGDPGPISYAPQACLTPPGPSGCASVPGDVNTCSVDGQVLFFESESCCCANQGLFGGYTRGETYCQADGSGGFTKQWRCQTGVLGSNTCSSN